ncbi:MAG: hypothetical protein ACLRWM_02135 [Streptococcus sp.]
MYALEKEMMTCRKCFLKYMKYMMKRAFRKLNDSDITAICKSYVNKVREIGGEFIDVVKSFLKTGQPMTKKRISLEELQERK